jgi:dTDP-4-dehydrorhamnose reductase
VAVQTDVLILGAKGMLGSACMRAFGAAATSESPPDAPAERRAALTVAGRDMDDFDLAIRKDALAAITALVPRLIINCAAATDVDRCETDHDYADRGNLLAPRHAAEAAEALGARLLHISTDFVFRGDKAGRAAAGPGGDSGVERAAYTESDMPDPISYYGASKLAGEQAVFATAPDALVVRTSWLYGLGGNHFPGKVLNWAADGGPLSVVDDQFGSPTYAEDLAAALKALVERDTSGLYHLGGAGCASRLEWARAALALAALDVQVLPARTADFPLPAARPANSCLDCGKAAALGVRLPAWRDSLARYIRRGHAC